MKTMNLSMVRFYLKLGALSVLLIPTLATAQIIPDDKLPVNSSALNQGSTTLIEGGTVSGSNLFHSFEQFSIPSNSSAYFNNTLDIQNIFSRVTGSSISRIDGVIQANGTANIFLLNPNGIVFAPDAMLNIGGSFLASTANSINFADGSQFSTKSSQSPLLTISVPIGLGIGSNPGTIQVQGTGHNLTLQNPILSPFIQSSRLNSLQVSSGKTLALIGGEIELKGGSIIAPGGRIELGATENGSVSLNQVINGWDLEYEGISSSKNVQLSQQSLASTSGLGNGSIHIQGAEVKFTDGSTALIQNQDSLPSGTLKINAELLEVNGTSLDGTIPSSVVSETVQSGNGADINISTRVLSVKEGASISTRTYSSGDGGDLLITASEAVNTNGFSPINPQLFTYIASATLGTGNSGDIQIITNQLNSKNGGSIGSVALGSGQGGSLVVDANNISLDGVTPNLLPSSLFAINAGNGQSGNLVINTSKLTLKNGSVIYGSNVSSESMGNITINASDSIQLEGVKQSSTFYTTSINTNSGTLPQFLQEILQPSQELKGDSGNIIINTRQLNLTDGADLSSNTFGTGNSGNIKINASDSIKITGDTFNGNFLSNVYTASYGAGKAGNININTRNLEISNGGQISVSAFDLGDSGNLHINASDSIKITGVSSNSKYPSGLYASSNDIGTAGNINVSARSISLDNQGQIETTTLVNEGGNIRLLASNLQLRNGSRISTDANVLGGLGNGGNIQINTDTLVALENSEIVATAFKGNGGNIQVTTQGLFLFPDSDITASSQFGIDGNVNIRTFGLDIRNSITPLQNRLVTTEQVIAGSCLAHRNVERGSFVITGSGGLPINPYSGIERWDNLTEVQPLEDEKAQSSLPPANNNANQSLSRKWQPGDPIVEAQALILKADGRASLVASSPQTETSSADSQVCEADQAKS